MRAVVKVKLSQKSSPSGLARYIAKDGINPEREGGNQRPLFTNRGDNDLSYQEANHFLNDGHGTPTENDLIHIIVSFKSEDFEALGATDEERGERLREVIREAMDEVVEGDLHKNHYLLRNKPDLQFKPRWIAGIHLNTENQHVHIALHKEVAWSKGQPLRVGRIPKGLLPRTVQNPDGSTRPVEGVIGDRVVAALDRALDRAREAGRERQEASTRMTNGSLSRDKILPNDRLFDLANKNPSLAGREMIRDLLLSASVESLNSPSGLRRALTNKSIDDPQYQTQSGQADEIGALSQELRDLYEKNATVINDTLVIPAEPHEITDERGGIRVIDISNAHEKILDPRLAAEFHRLCRAIAGESADLETEIKVFKHYLDQIKIDDEGRPFDKSDKNFKEKRAAALDRTLKEMRLLAGPMAQEETKWSVEIAQSIADLSYAFKVIPDYEDARRFHGLIEKLLESEDDLSTRINVFNYYYHLLERDSDGRLPAPDNDAGRAEAFERTVAELRAAIEGEKPPKIEPNDPGYVAALDPSDVDLSVTPDRESVLRYNSTARTAHLGAESLRFPESWDYKTKERIISRTLPRIDRQIEAGVPLYNQKDEKGEFKRGIISDINSPLYPDRDEVLRRMASLIGWSGDKAQQGTLTRDELNEVRDTLLGLTLAEQTSLKSRRDFLEDYHDLTERKARGASMARTFRRLFQVESLMEALPSDQPQTGAVYEIKSAGAGSSFYAMKVTAGSMNEASVCARAFFGADHTHSVNEGGVNRDWNRDGGAHLYVSLSGEPDSLRLPVSNIRVLDAIWEMAEGARLDLHTWNKDGSPIIRGLTQAEYAERLETAAFLKEYVYARLRDPGTRRLHRNKAFREAHESLALARKPEELLPIANSIRNNPSFDRNDRALLLFGRVPDDYTQEMRDSLSDWWATKTERVKAIAEGERAMSPDLEKLIATLDSQNNKGWVDLFFAALKHPPEELYKPEARKKSEELGIWELRQRLNSDEQRHLLNLTWARKQSFAGRDASLREAAPRLEDSRLSHASASPDNESLRIYEAGAKAIEQSLVEARPPLSQAERREQARQKAWGLLVSPEALADSPTGKARLLSDTIADLQERVQPKARLATEEVNKFIREKIGLDSSGPIHQETLLEALGKLDPREQQNFKALKRYEAELREEWANGFKIIDAWRQEMIAARESKEAEKPPTPRVDSYREYLGYVAEIEKQLVSEEIRSSGGAEKNENKTRRLTREDRLEIRDIAIGLAWERLEPERIYADAPGVMKLLSLSESVARLRYEIQPQARAAAQRLDSFIRLNFNEFIGSRNPEQLAEMRMGYYYRGDKFPEAELDKLSPGDRRMFTALKTNADRAFNNLKGGFETIDEIRRGLEIDKNGNGANEAGKQTPAHLIDLADGAIKKDNPQEHHADADLQRLNDRRILGDAIVERARADCAIQDYVKALTDYRGAGRGDDRSVRPGQTPEADLRNLVVVLGTKAKDAVTVYQNARQSAEEVITNHQNRGEQLPLPFVARNALVDAQDQAIKHGFADHADRLERLRAALAKEHGVPMRSDRELVELAAQIVRAEAELKLRGDSDTGNQASALHKLSEALAGAYVYETALREQNGSLMPGFVFTREEGERLSSFAPGEVSDRSDTQSPGLSPERHDTRELASGPGRAR